MTVTSSDLINECTNTILNYLIDSIGKQNIISVVLTGSVARHHETYKIIDGKLYLESDLDVLIVVKPLVVIKALTLAKPLSNKLTLVLRKNFLLSHVSFSIATEKLLLRSEPSIIYQDLRLFGKVIFGKEKDSLFANYETKDIPLHDLYRLIFNRSIEALDEFVKGRIIGKKSMNSGNDSILRALEKLNFALIQTILIRHGILMFKEPTEKIKANIPNELKDSEILNTELICYENILKTRKSTDAIDNTTIEKYWIKTISHVEMTIGFLSGLKDSSTISNKKLLFEEAGILKKSRLSSLIFLQFFRIYCLKDILRPILFVLRFGSDFVYFPLYDLFLSSGNLLNGQLSLSRFENDDYKKSWLDSYNKYFKIWKLTFGA